MSIMKSQLRAMPPEVPRRFTMIPERSIWETSSPLGLGMLTQY